MDKLLSGALLSVLAACAAVGDDAPPPASEPESAMQLGAFSISLAVRDLETSRAFYEKLGFDVVGGVAAQNWLILRNATTTIGLFQGMFERNILTFNPGWSADQETLETFDDVRAIQRVLESRGLELEERADESSAGPAHLTLVDPDGNPILIDQHLPSPAH